MNTKPFFPAVIGATLIIGVLLMTQCRTLHTQKSEVSEFLTAFNNNIKAGNTDSVLACFDNGKQNPIFTRLTNILLKKKDPGNLKPVVTTSLDVSGADIKFINDEIAVAKIPSNFTNDSLKDQQSTLILTVRKTLPHQYKIVVVDAKRFLTDYIAYESLITQKTMSDKDKYSLVTLEAFKTADSLKKRYDSVVWFAHMDKRTFFYVVKGKWDMYNDINRYKDSVIQPYKMGLVGPDLKEIIPPEYDLIHNINGTFPGLVEVEKDNRKGFYDLNGKIAVPVNYDQVFPVNDDVNLAVLQAGDDYFYLKQDMTISEKVDLKMADFISKIKNLANSFDLYKKALEVVTEYNSKTEHGAIYIAPSYLADLNIIAKVTDFKNPLRKIDFEDAHLNYKVDFQNTDRKTTNWLEASFYSIRDYFLGGRSEFYDRKNVVIVDKKNNRILTHDIYTNYEREEGGGESLTGPCNINSIRALNDSLYEIKAGAIFYAELYDSLKMINGGPYYHYFMVKNNKLSELPNNRYFGFTKYIKMDESYLNACYVMLIGKGFYKTRQKKTINEVSPEMLRYMKNEIFADYAYKFKDKRWENLFIDMPSYNQKMTDNKPYNANVDDSLTLIDKYNIEWINQKLKEKGVKPQNTFAAK